MGDSPLSSVSISSAIHPNVHSPSDVFRQYRGRHQGIVKALTQDVEEFYEQCDPGERALCLYGRPNGTWEVNVPVDEVPVELPEPVCGINFARDGTPKKVWLSLVAIHSDAWLMSMAFYHAGRVAFDRDDRELLFKMIISLPTVYEAVKESYEKQTHNLEASSKNMSSSQMLEEEDGTITDVSSEDEATNKCAACRDTYNREDEDFWIGCDHCERWFHGDCVGMTAERAEEIKRYMCPGCSYKSRK